MSYSNTSHSEVNARRIVISRTNSQNQTIPTTSRFWEPLSYPLLFPHGTLGWGLAHSSGDNTARLGHHGLDAAAEESETTQIWFYRARLLREERFAIFGRLTNEYVVDMFSRNLEARLHYIRSNQQRIRQDDAEQMGLGAVEDNENVYLPSSFLGSNRWAAEQIADSLAIAAMHGAPTFFITNTCNRAWPEIVSQLRPGQEYHDLPVVVCRVFKRKLALLQQTLRTTMFPDAGKLLYMVHSVEFQKRGLPHAHILLKFSQDCSTAQAIDSVISAEIPSDPEDASLVRRNPGDEMVVPYNLELLRKYKCHMNFEAANSSQLFQYLFKYIHKGPDRTKYRIFSGAQSSGNSPLERIDEIEEYWDARYLSATEATWRILGFHITHKHPGVSSLPVHLPSHSSMHRQYQRRSASSSQSLSLLERYFRRPQGMFTASDHSLQLFASLSYAEYYSTFRLATYDVRKEGHPRYFEETTADDGITRMHVIQRVQDHAHVARLQPARVSEGERFFLRALLQHRAANSFLDLRTVDGVQHDTFQDAANALGLFAHDNEGELSVLEAITTLSTPRQLRTLFVHLLHNECIPTPRAVWDKYVNDLSKDHIIASHGVEAIGVSAALDELAHLLEEYGKSLAEYGLPEPTHYSPEIEHELRRWEAQRSLMLHREEAALNDFNAEQRSIFDQVVAAVERGQSLQLFVDGKAGRGKTFLVNTICDHFRARNSIVIATATSAYAAQLYPGGRTTHSAFKVPVNEHNEMLLSPIERNSSRGELLCEAAVIIWDEAPMANKAVLACIDDTLQRTCPVIRRGTRAQIVDASIRSSPLWDHFAIAHLFTPIRNAADPEFASFVDSIGDGAGPDVALDMLEKAADASTLIAFVYPPQVLNNPAMCVRRSILAPTNAQVDKYNEIVINRIPGPQRTYLAADSLKEVEAAGIESPDSVLDYVARQTPPGLPPHSLTIKVNGVYRLLRNLSIDRGLVKNVRVLIVAIGNRLVTPMPKFKCPPCGVEFSSSEALAIHFRNFAVHPKCPRCNSAFVDQTQLKLHMAVHEKKFACGPCGREVETSERQKHYKESPNHPTCFVCEEGFYQDADLDKHLATAHLATRCSRCRRQFRSADELQNHYLVSPVHPHCAVCEIGFIDDVACDKHMDLNHPRPPPSIEPAPVAQPSTSVSPQVPTSSLEAQRSTQSSPLVQRSSLSEVALAIAEAPSGTPEKSEGDYSYETVEASSHVQRAVSEPTVPTVSSIGPSSVQGATMMASRSPTISELSFDDMVRRRNVKRHPESESTMSLRSVSSSSMSSNWVHNPAFERPPQQSPFIQTTVQQPTGVRPASVLSQRASPRDNTPVPEHSQHGSSMAVPSERVYEPEGSSRPSSRMRASPIAAAVPTLTTSVSRPSTPGRVRTPLPARPPVSRPLSRVSVLSMNSQPAGSLSQKPSMTAVEPPSLSDSEGTIEAPNPTLKRNGAVARQQGQSGAVSWHCRSCLQDPCVAPTATICGHIFCTACIMQELAKTGSCPVCGKLFLLRLHVESD
ncbi:hypothetical protein BN946_scf184845.g64 [Trametes cinnabarina]|uniref:ATP-dependent DNA helicase n=1 Tax=Pycnoporus cinnabarinus TaxID=5643 RepID=A0A060SG11_PYCCI|nr:hypothetical protein BN946_scf184845.g64 [Trametes cinnabarina]